MGVESESVSSSTTEPSEESKLRLLALAGGIQDAITTEDVIRSRTLEAKAILADELEVMIGGTVALGGLARTYMQRGRLRWYEDYTDRPVTVRVPFNTCQILGVDRDRDAVTVEHPEARDDKQPMVLLDSIYFDQAQAPEN